MASALAAWSRSPTQTIQAVTPSSQTTSSTNSRHSQPSRPVRGRCRSRLMARPSAAQAGRHCHQTAPGPRAGRRSAVAVPARSEHGGRRRLDHLLEHLHSRRIAAIVAVSSTTITSAPAARSSSKFGAPIRVRSPSQIVSGANAPWRSPAASERAVSSAPAGSASTRRVCGLACCRASAVPLARPPPPTGTTSIERAVAVQQLQRGGALPRHHRRVGVWMDESRRYRPALWRRRLTIGGGRRAAPEGGAMARDVGQQRHRAFRHHHVTGNATRARGQRQGGAVVAGGGA